MKLILRQGLRLIVLGIVFGGIAALWLAQLLGTLLFRVSPTDPLIFFSVSFLLLFVAVSLA